MMSLISWHRHCVLWNIAGWLMLITSIAWANDEANISLSVHQVPIDDLVAQLASQVKTPIVLIDAPSNAITLEIQHRRFEEVLAVIDAMVGLESRLQNGVWVVASPEHWQGIENKSPLSHRYFAIAHRDIGALEDWVTPLLSHRGSIELDLSNNRAWIEDIPVVLDRIEKHIEWFDQPMPQVLIESRIVIANRDFNRALGMAFGIETRSSSDVPADSSAFIELPVANASGQINVALLSAQYQLDAQLSALEASGLGRVISTPRLLTANRAEAFIQQGVAVPFEAVLSGEDGQRGAVSVQFREAALGLKATPLILSDGRIQLDLEITQDTVGQIFQTGRGGSVPSIDTRQLGTRVFVSDGQTLVLGGIFQEQDAKLSSGIPGLSQLPGLGRLFERTSHEDQRRELLIFITPTLFP